MSEQSDIPTPEEIPVVEPVVDPRKRLRLKDTLTLLAHLSIFLNLFTGLLGTAAALRSSTWCIRTNPLRGIPGFTSLIFQLVFFFSGGLLIGLVWLITGLLSMFWLA